MKKITFLGDIVCDKPLLRAALKGKEYDFNSMLNPLKEIFKASDYVIGALETTFSGENNGYNSRSFAYNSPDVLAESLYNCGINILTTANNHCLDYGIEGVSRTVRVLDKLSILHTGTMDLEKPYLVIELNGTRIALLSYTSVMNMKPGSRPISKKEKKLVNLITEVNPQLSPSLIVKRLIPTIFQERLKKLYYKNKVKKHIPTIRSVKDDGVLQVRDDIYIQNFVKIVGDARKEADIVIACIHSGGQFNKLPGKRTEELFRQISPYVDAIIGNHPHVIQKFEMVDSGAVVAYSLGTMNLSLSADYISFENLPQYSMALNIYIDEKQKAIKKVTASFLCAEEDCEGYVRVYPITEMIDALPDQSEKILKDVNYLLSIVKGGMDIENRIQIQEEYILWE